MTFLQVIIEITKNVNMRITDQTDLTWTDYNISSNLKSELEGIIAELDNGNLQPLEKLNEYFLPTGLFQEIAIPNGWKDDFILMANQFDDLFGRIKAAIT